MSTPKQRLADVFVELVGSALGDPFDVPGLLSTLTDRSHELLGGCATCVVVAPDAREGVQVAGSDAGVRRLQLDAVGWGESPGLDCRRVGAPLPRTAFNGSAAQQRWPRYAPRALKLGYTHVAALPLQGHTQAVGALVLLGNPESPVSDEALVLGQSLADITAITLLREHEVRENRTLTAQLEHALTSRLVIEQAKGALAFRKSLSLGDAFALLRGYARSHQRLLSEVARDVVEGRLDLD